MHAPCPLQSDGQDRRLHSLPSNPGMQIHIPVWWSHKPLDEHSVSACAVSVALASSAHANPSLHLRKEQSPPVQPKKHLHLMSGVEHSPCPLHRLGHAAWATSADPKSMAHAIHDWCIRFMILRCHWKFALQIHLFKRGCACLMCARMLCQHVCTLGEETLQVRRIWLGNCHVQKTTKISCAEYFSITLMGVWPTMWSSFVYTRNRR